MRAVVMVGAGASCSGPGIKGPKHESYLNSQGTPELVPGNPPLGSQLLHRLSHIYPDCWDEQIVALFEGSESDFEEGMGRMYQRLWLEGSSDDRTKFGYCIYRMAEFFANWLPDGEETLYGRLVDQLISGGLLQETGCNPELSFASLNYERSLEFAIEKRGIAPVYRGRTHPTAPNTVPVWKPHGSCNFVASAKAGTVGFPGPDQLNGDLKVLLPHQLHAMFDRIADHLDKGPINIPVPVVMSLYMRGKLTMTGDGAIQRIRQHFVQDVHDANVLIMIGVRPVLADNHLFKSILERKGPTIFVGGPSDELQTFSDTCAGPVLHVAETFERAVAEQALLAW